MKYLKKLSDYATVGGLGAILATGLTGCGDNAPTEPVKAEQPKEKNQHLLL